MMDLHRGQPETILKILEKDPKNPETILKSREKTQKDPERKREESISIA
jgi:hypothetical protein